MKRKLLKRALKIEGGKKKFSQVSESELMEELKALNELEKKTRQNSKKKKKEMREKLLESVKASFASSIERGEEREGEKREGEKREGVVWIDVEKVSDSQMIEIGKIVGIHPLTIEDCTRDDSTREKNEMFDNYLFLVCNEENFQRNSNIRVRTNLNLLVFSNFLLSIHRKPIRSLVHVVFRVTHLKDPLCNTPDWIMYTFLDVFTDYFVERTRALEREVFAVQSILHLLKSGQQDEIITRIDFAIRNLSSINTLVKIRKELIEGLLQDSQEDGTFISKITTRVYLRDVKDHINYILLSLTQSDDSLQQLRKNYLTHISLEMARAANESLSSFPYKTFLFLLNNLPFSLTKPSSFPSITFLFPSQNLPLSLLNLFSSPKNSE